MHSYRLSHVPDPVLLRDLSNLVARERATTAELLAHLAEVDARKLYVPAAHPSMFSYCVRELGLSEEGAFKRIRAARAARQYPAIFPMLADGRLHVSAVVLLAPYLTPQNAADLLAAAARRSKSEIEALLARRFPQPDLPERLVPLSAPMGQLDPGTVESNRSMAPQLSPGTVTLSPAAVELRLAPGQVLAPVRVALAGPPPKLAPLAPERFGLQVTIDQATHDKLRHAQELLGLPAGELAAVLDRALDLLVRQLERQKFAAADRPRQHSRRPSARPRHIPAEVKRAVWQRDGGQCTFTSENGHRCPARARLEFDHMDPVARGGQAKVDRIRLRCRAHNQYAAECEFGAGFMAEKRAAAREAAGAALA